MKQYQVEFFVVSQDYTPLLGVSAVQELDLINVNHANVMTMQESNNITSDKGTTQENILYWTISNTPREHMAIRCSVSTLNKTVKVVVSGKSQ